MSSFEVIFRGLYCAACFMVGSSIVHEYYRPFDGLKEEIQRRIEDAEAKRLSHENQSDSTQKS
uniref:Uncharacterized protein n=1 Tax=Tetranychus urticae TaxID=32264 RepID=T1K0K1_TETUR